MSTYSDRERANMAVGRPAQDDFDRGRIAGLSEARGEAQSARLAMVDRCYSELPGLQTLAREAASALDDAVNAFTYGKGTIGEKAERLTGAVTDARIAEARLAGARQLAAALGLVAKATP